EIHATEILAKAVKRKAAKKVAAPRQPSVHKGSSVPAKTRAPVHSGKVDTTRRPPTQTRRPTPQTKEPYQSTRRPSGRPPQSRGRPSYRDSQRRPSSRDRGSRAPYRKEIPKVPEELMPIVKEIDGKEKQEGIFLDEKLKHLKKVAVEKIYEELKKAKGVTKVVFDGVITQRLIDVCDEKKINTIVGARISEIKRRPSTVRYYTFPY
ncbi:MAG: hypothetical protein ACTSSH_09020, partial [Candidatus Heimdallarchaeota archaeon]